jgi:hypothetical protein
MCGTCNLPLSKYNFRKADSSIITKIKENNKFWNCYRKTKITSHLVDVKKLRREIRQEVRREYLNFIRAAEDSLLNDPKKF